MATAKLLWQKVGALIDLSLFFYAKEIFLVMHCFFITIFFVVDL